MIALDDISFTGIHDEKADGLLRGVLPRIRDAVLAYVENGGAAAKIRCVAMGGGYGRGEGGARNGRLCNDVDFYTVVKEDTTAAEMDEIAAGLEKIAEPFTRELGAEVEFCYPKKLSRVRHDRRRVMIQELIRGNVGLFGMELTGVVPELPAEDLPPGEAARLLMNRGIGLIFVAEKMDVGGKVKPEDAEFVIRNINKAILGAGDARLIATGRYAWSIRDRAEALGMDVYQRAVEEKFSPHMTLPSDVRQLWRMALKEWRDSLSVLREKCGGELRSRRIWEAARWLHRRKTVGPLATLGMDCTVRVLIKIEEVLSKECPRMNPELLRDWQVFN